MNPPIKAPAKSTSLSVAQRVDAICDEFESAWLAVNGPDEPRPEIESWLSSAEWAKERGTVGPRLALLSELLLLEFFHRRRLGEALQVAEYLQRFPEVDSGWLANALAGSAPPAPREASHASFLPSRADVFPAQANPRPTIDSEPGRDNLSDATCRVANDDTGPPPTITFQAPGMPELFGRYRINRSLGQGAMGAVYLAFDTQLDRQVALKIPLFTGDDGPELLQRFRREGQVAAKLRHPNVCPVYDVGEIDGRPFIAMAYIEGRSLKDFTRAKKRQPERQAALVVRKLALGLAEAHAHGIVHRDLKPSNVMIDGRGEPVVMDFGLAQRQTVSEAPLTQTDSLLGTPAYMAPEQAQGRNAEISPASDVYGLGVVLYELLTGEVPFDGSVLQVLVRIAGEAPRPPGELRPGLDPRLEAICLKMLAKKPADRYATMKELAQALGGYLRANEASRASSDSAPEASNAERSRAAAAALALGRTAWRTASRGYASWVGIPLQARLVVGGLALAAAAVLTAVVFVAVLASQSGTEKDQVAKLPETPASKPAPAVTKPPESVAAKNREEEKAAAVAPPTPVETEQETKPAPAEAKPPGAPTAPTPAESPMVPESPSGATPEPPRPPKADPGVTRVTGLWKGKVTNTLGESGFLELLLEEADDGTITGNWVDKGHRKVSGKRVDPTRIELTSETATRSYEIVILQGPKELTLEYIATRLNANGTYRGKSTLVRDK